MLIFNYGEKYPRPAVVCLGRFESLHRGHAEIIASAKKIATKNNADVVLMTYDEGDNPRFRGLILDFSERLDKLDGLVDGVMRIVFDEAFIGQSSDTFLTILSKNIQLVGLVCGFDFRFGKNRTGDTQTLTEFCKNNNLELSVIQKVTERGEKISSSEIKKHIENGEIAIANDALGYNFYIEGEVKQGRMVGRELGFPTANVAFSKSKCRIKNGVYHTKTVIFGKEYDGITNVGSAPTFSESEELIETHLKGYDGNLYGKTIRVEFIKRIRDVKKFSSVEELKAQLKQDLSKI